MEIANVLNMRNQRSQNLRVETDVLQPQYITDRECVFNIRKSGILDGGSRIIIPLTSTVADSRLPLSSGVYCIIRNATLRTSKGVNICQTEDVDYLMTINNQFVEPEKRKKRGVLVNGSQMNFAIVENTVGGERGAIAFDCGTDIENRFKVPVDATRTDGVEYSIKLSQLFPNLFPFQIPLFLLKDGIQLHLTFTSDINTGQRVLSADGTQANGGQIQVVNNEVKFVSDHLFFDNDVVNKLESLNASSNGIVIPYGDYNLIKNVHTGIANPVAGSLTELKTRRNIGLSNLKCRFMLIHNQEGGVGDSSTPRPNQLAGLGKYASCGGIAGTEIQIVINNENYYPRTIIRSNRLYNELEDVYGISPSIPYGLYTPDGSFAEDAAQATQAGGIAVHAKLNSCAVSTNEVFGTNQSINCGSFQCLGVNLATSRRQPFNVGMSIGQSPVEIFYNKNLTNGRDHDILQRIFVCIERMMVIKNGEVFTTNS